MQAIINANYLEDESSVKLTQKLTAREMPFMVVGGACEREGGYSPGEHLTWQWTSNDGKNRKLFSLQRCITFAKAFMTEATLCGSIRAPFLMADQFRGAFHAMVATCPRRFNGAMRQRKPAVLLFYATTPMLRQGLGIIGRLMTSRPAKPCFLKARAGLAARRD